MGGDSYGEYPVSQTSRCVMAFTGCALKAVRGTKVRDEEANSWGSEVGGGLSQEPRGQGSWLSGCSLCCIGVCRKGVRGKLQRWAEVLGRGGLGIGNIQCGDGQGQTV